MQEMNIYMQESTYMWVKALHENTHLLEPHACRSDSSKTSTDDLDQI
jgi:hypothetical protein